MPREEEEGTPQREVTRWVCAVEGVRVAGRNSLATDDGDRDVTQARRRECGRERCRADRRNLQA